MPSNDTDRAALEYLIDDIVGRDLSAAPALQAKIRVVLLDTVACAIGSMNDPVVQQVAERFGMLSPGPVRIPGTDIATGIADAAFVMTMAACWFEACEGVASAHGRPGLSVIPAAVMIGSAKGLPVNTVLTAIALGYEIGGRLGAAYRVKGGIHVDGTWGLAASTATAAYLLGGDTPAIRNAVNLALCQMPGSLYLPVITGDTARNTYAANASAESIRLAQAALAGVTAPDTVDAEVLRIIMDDSRSTTVDWSMCQPLKIEDAYIKMFAAVRHVHYGVSCALDWVEQHGNAAAQTIDGLSLSIYEEAITYCGVRQPRTPIQAQFSLSYGIAHALTFGSLGPEAYASERLTYPEVQRLEALLEIAADPHMPTRGAVLLIAVARQTETISVNALVGDPGNPLSEEDVTGKAKTYMSPVIGKAAAETMIKTVMTADLEEAFNLPHYRLV
jgi:2-methylcitrate dehydratase PrpD